MYSQPNPNEYDDPYHHKQARHINFLLTNLLEIDHEHFGHDALPVAGDP
jgi:hypothetical protein